jgi:hypothetical protein
MKVIDCFSFWREFNALEIRLEELYEVVDFFVIIESAYTHTGQKKPFYLTENLNAFMKFKNKLIVINDDYFNPLHSPIERGNYQRALIDNELIKLKLDKEDLIIISDSDEILKKIIVEDLKKNPRNVIVEVAVYSSYLNLYLHEWPRIRVLQYKDFRGAQKEFRETFMNTNYKLKRFKFYPFLRINPWFSASTFDKFIGAWVGFNRKNINVISSGGWHFTKIYNLETLMEKISFSGHTELNTSNITLKSVRDDLNNRRVPYGRKELGSVKVIDGSFPKFVQNNRDYFKSFILDFDMNSKEDL